MFHYRHIEIFQAIMKTGSITGAAHLLFTSQPTISREIAWFETLCGFPLFDRRNAKIYPTEAAFILYEEILQSNIGLERVFNTAQQIKNHQIGELQLCCLPFLASTLLPTVIAKFKSHTQHSQICITPLESPFIETQLSSQQFHLGLIEHQSIPLGTTLQFQFKSNEVCILPDIHPLLDKAELQPEDFTAHEFISLAKQDPYRQQIDQVFHQHHIQRQLSIETHSAHSICRMVQKGLGISIVNPLIMLDYLGSGLQWRPITFSIPFTLSLVRPDYRPVSRLADLFIADLIAVLSDAQQLLEQHHVANSLIKFSSATQ